MAIEKTYLSTVDAPTNAAELVEWLNANAAEYFDSVTSVTVSGGVEVTCTVGGANIVLRIGASAQQKSTITLANGATLGNIGGSFVPRFTWAARTAHGIVLQDRKAGYMWIITKSDADTTCVYAQSPAQIAAADLVNSLTVLNLDEIADRVTQSELTALCPFVFPEGHYTPNMFITPYSQYKGTAGIIAVAGLSYVYDGYVALKC